MDEIKKFLYKWIVVLLFYHFSASNISELFVLCVLSRESYWRLIECADLQPQNMPFSFKPFRYLSPQTLFDGVIVSPRRMVFEINIPILNFSMLSLLTFDTSFWLFDHRNLLFSFCASYMNPSSIVTRQFVYTESTSQHFRKRLWNNRQKVCNNNLIFSAMKCIPITEMKRTWWEYFKSIDTLCLFRLLSNFDLIANQLPPEAYSFVIIII